MRVQAFALGSKLGISGTHPVLFDASAFSVVIAWPSIRTVPEVGRETPTAILMVVVLPAPLRPTKPTTSPFLTSKLTAFIAGPCLDENIFVACLTSIKPATLGS